MRILATILLKNNSVVQSHGYGKYRVIGNPQTTVKHLDAWQVDEIIALQIDGNFSCLLQNIKAIASVTSTPVSVGGDIISEDCASLVLSNGADRVCLQSILDKDPEQVISIARRFGGQSITLKIDYSYLKDKFRSFKCTSDYFQRIYVPRINMLKMHDIEEIFFNAVDSDGITSEPFFDPLFHSMDLSSFSIILGGGLIPKHICKLYPQFISASKTLSFSFSNYFYQRELANFSILEQLSFLNINHRLLK